MLYVAKSETPKVVRWRTFLGEFDCDIRHIRHIPGETNLLPDMLFRLWPLLIPNEVPLPYNTPKSLILNLPSNAF